MRRYLRSLALGLLAGVIAAPFAMAEPPPDAVQARLAAGHFAEPLVATGPTYPAEDEALARAVAVYEKRARPDDFSSLTGFLRAYPSSAWRAAVLTDLGIDYLHYGYFSRALAAWESAWRERTTVTGNRAEALVDRALGELVRLTAALGHKERLEALLTEIGGRPVSGPATELVQQGREALWVMNTDPKHLYLCGPTALKMLMLSQHASLDAVRFLNKVRAGPKGTSLAEVAALAAQAKLAYAPVFRRPGEEVPVPSIVHWKVGHFAAIVGERDGRFEIQDPTFGHQSLWVTRPALDAEASGYFLAPVKDAAKAGWREVDAGQAAHIWGAGPIAALFNFFFGPPANPPCDKCPCGGMCGANISEQAVALMVTDRPVGYAPPKGPSAEVTITYNQREAAQPANFNYFNISQKWTLNWLSYIQDDPTAPGANVQRFLGDGQNDQYSGFNAATGAFAPVADDGSLLVLTKASPITYTRTLKDGTAETFAQSDGAPRFPRTIFLSRVTDPQGNALNLDYGTIGGRVRLLSLTDATGRKTTFSYASPVSPLLITKITDPFGRSASLAYDGMGRLVSITDVLGLTSKFTYDPSSLVNSLTTPYGTTRFAFGGGGTTRFLNIVDPLGYGEREETIEPSVGPASEPQAPTGMILFNEFLNWRNSFHWDKHQYAAAGCTPAGGCQYRDARLTHFMHDPNDINTEWYTVESRKEPLENRVWYNYPGQAAPQVAGTNDEPSKIGRVLDSGQTQLSEFAYNDAGNPTQITDPLGRTTVLSYAANGIDVTQVAQATAGGGSATTASFTYNSQHRPLTYTDAAGRTTNYTYNGAGQLLSETNPLGQKTSYSYNSLGFLTTIVNAHGKKAASFTYDAAGRVASFTDSEGWAVNYTYDAADRLTKATYLDGTTDQYTYNRLDLVAMKDRQGRVWNYTYDADRRLTAVTDPLGHKTSYAYFESGALKSLTDPDGRRTSWDIDVESRPVAKHYADGTTTAYQYEHSTSRLKSMTDALGQVKIYSYALDNRLAGFRYDNALNPTPNVAFAYDPVFSRIVSMTDGAGTTTYSYVPVGSLGALRLQREAGPLAAISYGYDALGRVVTRNVAGAPAESFQYDPIGRLTQHSDALGRFVLSYLGQTGQLASRGPAGAGVATDWTYLSNSGDRRLAGIANATARQYRYTTSPEDLITQINESKGASPLQTWSMTYDNDTRLLAANSTSGAKFGYALDPAGNITQISQPTGTTVLSYNNTNALTAVGAQAVVSDADGNTVSDGARTYSWDAESRLVGITYAANPGKRTSFAYDGLDRRVAIATTVAGKTTVEDFIWCGARLCQSRNGPSAVNRLYYDEGEAIPASKALLYYGPDQIGSVRDVFATSPVFSMVQAYDYDPYGSPTKTPPSGPFTDFRYAGMLYHADSGLYLTQYRAYDPRTGRWLSRDGLAERMGPNLYLYSDDSPITNADPFGLFPFAPPPPPYLVPHPVPSSAVPINNARAPDYVNLSGGGNLPTGAGGGGSLSFDRYGHVHVGPGYGIGTPGFSASLTANWLNQPQAPCENQLNNFLNGYSFTFGGGFGLGGTETFSSGQSATGVGAFTPQFSANGANSWQTPEFFPDPSNDPELNREKYVPELQQLLIRQQQGWGPYQSQGPMDYE